MTERVWRSMKALRVLLFFTACAWPAVLWADGKCQARNEPKTAQCLNHMRSHKVLIQFFLFFFHRVWICLKSNRIMTTERSNKALKVKRWQEKTSWIIFMTRQNQQQQTAATLSPQTSTAADQLHRNTHMSSSCSGGAAEMHSQQLLRSPSRRMRPKSFSPKNIWSDPLPYAKPIQQSTDLLLSLA